MTEQPASVAREAKSIHQSLKELLKAKEPFDKEVDFQRKNLRRRYLNLLLVHPNAKESQDVENHLWMQTSYAFISSYKQRIAALDRTIQNHQRQQQGQAQGQQPRSNNHHGVVEHRKLVQRFRQFLADEEKFWTQLVLRLRRLFDLTEAQPALIALGLVDEVPSITETDGRNHFQFPAEDPTLSFPPATPEERQGRLAILSKALICLGDIARYRELYNDNNGKREDARRGRNRRGGAVDNPPRPKNYSKAQLCYEQARFLVPSDGNPFHQLAILASYKKDSFASLIYYYRALCVSQPYDTAAENLGTVLSKALEVWRQRMKRDRDRNPADAPAIRVRVENFQENIVVLHALWRVGMDKGIDKMKSISPKHSDKVGNEFHALVHERLLPIDTISNILVLSQGALWKHRMIRHVPASHSRNQHPTPVPPGTSKFIEWEILKHLLDLHCSLLEVGKDELKEPPPMDGPEDLAQRISATFRRTLPALRSASKWLRANFTYVAQDLEFTAFQEKEQAKGVEVQKKAPQKISGYSVKTRLFWETYAQFIVALSLAFPVAKLPAFDAPLEEDIEMRGFLPLKKLMGEARKVGDGEKTTDGNQAREQVHPNVEQLMRISDLLDDAYYLAKIQNSPLLILNNHIMFNPDAVEPIGPRSHTEVAQLSEDPAVSLRQRKSLDVLKDTYMDVHNNADRDVDEMTEATSLTEDDPVRDAFTVLDRPEGLVDEDEEDNDEIVWDPRANISPVMSPKTHATPFTSNKHPLTPQALSPRSPARYQPNNSNAFNIPMSPLPPPAATTAQDLLHDVMSGSANLGLSAKAVSTAPQPMLLFGSQHLSQSGGPQHLRPSIWSASSDEQPLMYNGSNGNAPGSQSAGHIYQTSPRQFQAAPGPSQDMSQQSTWTSSYPNQSQNSQQNYVGTLPSASFAQPPQMMLSSPTNNQRHQQHQRMLSSSVAGSTYANRGSVQQDPFVYSPTTQMPIHRPQPNLPLHASSSDYLNLTQSLSINAMNGYGGIPNQYYTNPPSTFHSRQMSMHDPRVNQQNYMSPPMSQIWSNTG